MIDRLRSYLTIQDDHDLEPIRKDLLQLLLTTASILGGIALITYAAVVLQYSTLFDLVPHAIVYSALVFVTFNRRLSYNLRVLITLSSLYSLGVVEFINNGLSGDGRILMLTLVALTSYFVGIRWGFITFLLAAATQLVLSFAIPLHWIPRPIFDDMDLTTSVGAWQVSILMFSILAAAMVGGGYLIISRLAHSLARQRSLTGELNRERDLLQVRVDEQTAELRASETQFRLLFESSVIPILLLRGDRLELVNPAYLRLIGARDASEIVGRSFIEFTNLEKRETVHSMFRAFLAGELLPEIYETIGARLDGSSFPCEISATRLDLPGEPATLVHLTDITERKQSAEKLQHLSTHDSLTGLYNRVYFDQYLDRHSQTNSLPCSILVVDINGLKLVNDTLGHAAGDVLIRDTGKVLAQVVRSGDIVARIGGDEFVVVMEAADEEAAAKISERIQAAVKAYNQAHPDHPLISLATGCATLKPGETLVTTLKRADEAMYADKRGAA